MAITRSMIFAAAASLAFAAPAANAAVLANCSAGAGLACFVDGANDHEADVEAAILAATGSAVDLFLYGKSDSAADASKFVFTGLGTKDGTWDVVDPAIKISYVTVKAGNGFAVYDVGGINFGDWTTSGILNNGGKQPDLSHLSFWTSDNTAGGVPEPSTWLTMIAGFGMVGVALRRRPAKCVAA